MHSGTWWSEMGIGGRCEGGNWPDWGSATVEVSFFLCCFSRGGGEDGVGDRRRKRTISTSPPVTSHSHRLELRRPAMVAMTAQSSRLPSSDNGWIEIFNWST